VSEWGFIGVGIAIGIGIECFEVPGNGYNLGLPIEHPDAEEGRGEGEIQGTGIAKKKGIDIKMAIVYSKRPLFKAHHSIC
jgi:hypothetical protein